MAWGNRVVNAQEGMRLEYGLSQQTSRHEFIVAANYVAKLLTLLEIV
jgi:hypothetical protein